MKKVTYFKNEAKDFRLRYIRAGKIEKPKLLNRNKCHNVYGM